MQQHIFPFESELQNTSTPEPSSSHCSSVQERLATYGSEALDSVEHLGLIIGDQAKAVALLQSFGSIPQLACASVQELLHFVSRAKAVRVVSALRLAAVALRQERQQLAIEQPQAVAELCSKMRFLDREV
jgi:DNA repair protein RadC